MLLGIQPVSASRPLAERQEPADLVAEFGERQVIRTVGAAHALNIVSRYNLPACHIRGRSLVYPA